MPKTCQERFGWNFMSCLYSCKDLEEVTVNDHYLFISMVVI